MKKWKIIIFVLILLFSIYKVIDSKNLDIKDNVYIVSQSDVHEKESISNNISDENDNQENFAMKLKDESHYIIPKIGDNLESYTNETFENDIENDLNNKNNLININTASIQELDTLPGIGEATANKIVNYREEKGKFNSIEEIKNVNGIGDKKYEELKTLISIE